MSRIRVGSYVKFSREYVRLLSHKEEKERDSITVFEVKRKRDNIVDIYSKNSDEKVLTLNTDWLIPISDNFIQISNIKQLHRFLNYRGLMTIYEDGIIKLVDEYNLDKIYSVFTEDNINDLRKFGFDFFYERKYESVESNKKITITINIGV